MARKQHVQHLLKGSLWSGLSTGARAVSTIVVNKLFAVHYGPGGIALLAHFQSLIAILTALPNGGVNVGLIRHLAQYKTTDERYRSFFWTGLWLNGLTFLLGLGIIWIFPDFFLDRFHWDTVPLAGGGMLSLGFGLFVLLLLHLFWLSVLLSQQALKPYVFVSFLTSAITIGSTWWAVGHLALPLVLVLFLVGQSFSGLMGGAILYHRQLIPGWQFHLSRETLKELGRFVVMAIATLVGGQLTDFLIREVALARFSFYETGLWQAVVKVSDNYTLVYASMLGMVYYPKISALLPKEEELKKYVKTMFFTLVPFLFIALLMVFFLRDYIVLFLFSREFLPGRALFDFQIAGDFLKMVAWVLSYVVMARAQVRLYVSTQLIFPAIYFLLVLWLIPIFRVKGFTMAYALSSGIYLLFHLYLFRAYFFSK